MPLTWSIEDCEDADEMIADPEARVVTDAFVFATIPIGMQTITESNWREFAQRLRMLERCTGPYLTVPVWTKIEAGDVAGGAVVKHDGKVWKVEYTGMADGEAVLRLSDYDDGAKTTTATLPSVAPIERHDGFEHREISVEEVKRRIGMRTNASPLTKQKFLNNLWKMVERDMPK